MTATSVVAARRGARWLRDIVRQRVGGRVDAHRLARAYPVLTSIDREIARARAELAEPYQRYVTTVSTPAMAMSLESAAFLTAFCTLTGVQRVLDLGSGFSSLVFRRCAPTVVSVDDDVDWLDATRAFLRQCGAEHDRVMAWSDFETASHQGFDLVFHDLGRMPRRQRTLARALGCATADGAVYLDDVHKSAYRRLAVAQVRRVGLRYLSLDSYTRDKLGRFGAFAIPAARTR